MENNKKYFEDFSESLYNYDSGLNKIYYNENEKIVDKKYLINTNINNIVESNNYHYKRVKKNSKTIDLSFLNISIDDNSYYSINEFRNGILMENDQIYTLEDYFSTVSVLKSRIYNKLNKKDKEITIKINQFLKNKNHEKDYVYYYNYLNRILTQKIKNIIYENHKAIISDLEYLINYDIDKYDFLKGRVYTPEFNISCLIRISHSVSYETNNYRKILNLSTMNGYETEVPVIHLYND